MIGELTSAIPADGGFYVWVRRAMGPFWGYQEGWLSLSASIFDMAIYPAFAVSYLAKFDPALTADWRGYGWSLVIVVFCCAWNLRGAPSVGEGSIWLSLVLIGAVFSNGRDRRLARNHRASGGAVGRAHIERGHVHGDPGGHVELHGLGQRIDRGR